MISTTSVKEKASPCAGFWMMEVGWVWGVAGEHKFRKKEEGIWKIRPSLVPDHTKLVWLLVLLVYW